MDHNSTRLDSYPSVGDPTRETKETTILMLMHKGGMKICELSGVEHVKWQQKVLRVVIVAHKRALSEGNWAMDFYCLLSEV